MNCAENKEEKTLYKFCGCFSYKQGKDTNIYMFFKDNNSFYTAKAGKNSVLEKATFNNLDDFKILLNDYASIKKMDFLLPKKAFIKESCNKNIIVTKNDLLSSELVYVNSIKSLYNFITNERSNIMEHTLNGYIKLIGHQKENNLENYDFYFEDENEEIYKINISYNKYDQFSVSSILQTSIEKVEFKELSFDDFKGQFYIPKNLEDITINVDEIEGALTPKGCEIGSILAFNTDFVSVFENQMYHIGKERAFSIVTLNKDGFNEVVDGVCDMNMKSIEMTNDILDAYEQIDEFPSFYGEKYAEKKDNKGRKLNAFGNYADYDDYR